MMKRYSLFLKRSITMITIFILTFISLQMSLSEEQTEQNAQAYPSRIAVFLLPAEEILLSIMEPERIVYVGHRYFENGNFYSPTMYLTKNIEGREWQSSDEADILIQDPDLIIFDEYFEGDYEDVFPLLYYAEIPVIFLKNTQSMEDIQDNIILLGQITGRMEQAKKLVHKMTKDIQKCKDEIAQLEIREPIKILFYDQRQRSFWIISRTLDFQNLFDDEKHAYDFAKLDKATIAQWNPDIILYDPNVIDSDGSVLEVKFRSESMEEYIRTDHYLSNTSAVENNCIFPFCPHESNYITESCMEVCDIIKEWHNTIRGKGTVN